MLAVTQSSGIDVDQPFQLIKKGSRTSEVLLMRFSLTPALTALALLASLDQQAAARGWEFDCKYGRFAQDLEGPRATDFSMRFNFDDITNKAAVVGITVCLM